jgi:hypothetical protein
MTEYRCDKCSNGDCIICCKYEPVSCPFELGAEFSETPKWERL